MDNVHGQCLPIPWTLSSEFMEIVHGFSGHCPWTQWTLSMDSDSGQFPWTQWTLSMEIVQSVSGLFPNILYRAMHREGVLMFSLGVCPSKLIDIKS